MPSQTYTFDASDNTELQTLSGITKSAGSTGIAIVTGNVALGYTLGQWNYFDVNFVFADNENQWVSAFFGLWYLAGVNGAEIRLHDGGGNGYSVRYVSNYGAESNTYTLYRNGVEVDSCTNTLGKTPQLRRTGGLIECYIDDVLVMDFTDEDPLDVSIASFGLYVDPASSSGLGLYLNDFTASDGSVSAGVSHVNVDGLTAMFVFDQPDASSWAGTYTEDVAKRPVFTVLSPDPEGGADVTRAISISRIISTSVVSTKLQVSVALKQPIYVAADEGTPVVSVSAGWITDTSSDTSPALVAEEILNNSTLDFPDNTGSDPFIHPEWATFTGVFGDTDLDLPFGVVPHCHHGTKKVIFTFTPSVGSPVVETVTTPTKIRTTKSLLGLGGLSVDMAVNAYLPTTNASDLAAGLVTVTAQVVPNIGTTAAKRTYTSEVYAGAQPTDVIYCAKDGNDANDGLSYATRVLTLERAGKRADDNQYHVIKFGAGTYSAAAGIGNSGFVNGQPVVFTADTDHGGTKTNVILQCGGQSITFRRVRFENLTLDIRFGGEISMWTGGPLSAQSRSLQIVNANVNCSNIGGRDGDSIGNLYSNVNGHFQAFNSVTYDYPGRPFPGCSRRYNCVSEKISIDGLRDCANTYMDLLYDLTDPLASHPDYLQALTTNEVVLDGAIALGMAGEPIFLAPSTDYAAGFRFWIDNAIIVQATDDAFHAQIAVATEVMTLGASYWGNVTLPNALTFLQNVTSSGSITHSNTWYIGNVQRELLSSPDGCLIHSCHSTNGDSADDVDFGFTKGDPKFVDGAYNADFDEESIDYTPDSDSPLLEATPRIVLLDVYGHNRQIDTAIGAVSQAPNSAPVITLATDTVEVNVGEDFYGFEGIEITDPDEEVP